jgi:hypothetical protein
VSAAEALSAAKAIGVRVAVDGCDLVLEAAVRPPADIVDQLALFKRDILRLLRPVAADWSAEDWAAFFDEQAGIAEFDRGLTRQRAEAAAFAECVEEWTRQTIARDGNLECLHCGGGAAAGPLVHLWQGRPVAKARVHAHCWAAWRAATRAEATAALLAVGLPTAVNSPSDFGKSGGH